MRKSFLTLHLPILAVFLMSVDLPTSGSNEFLKQPIKPVTIEKELLLSKIFDWFDDDFEKKAGTVKNFVVPYLAKTPAEKTLFLSDEVDVEYLDYNWKLNQ